ncbi:hypothetical protein E1B28_004426 [Marasmius oreades]|uniref:WIBG Mago-binding domain-containing protein n=1 Tax=Marasmius oreades TaxID=181124 RepID=A0A9P8AD19_9AGAR|nr:uncharacterized protein E1B28_004426 [Marasmius oreades]KAG7097033.1 hypothetical protein E1B28_004426 [Marasmius oreades]
MSRPPIDPPKTTAGIVVDPHTLDRVIPESKRPDGSVRKQIKIRPGFTPQEDVKRFRGTKQTQMDVNALPKGHIVGWVPSPNKESEANKPMSKSAKKNAKRREKKEEKRNVAIKDNWEDDDDDDETEKNRKSTSVAEASEPLPPSVPTLDPDALATDLKDLKVQ